MKSDCREFRGLLADMAEGQDVPGLQAHLSECPSCRKELLVLTHMMQSLRKPVFDPSDEAIARASALMPKRVVRTARLVLGQMGLVRSTGSEEFQLVFEEEGIHARLMYRPLPAGWSVTGRIEGEVLSVEGHLGTVEVEDSGRFRFEVEDLRETQLEVESSSGPVRIPAASEVNSDGSERSS